MASALITGASSGIGKATAHALAAEGYDLALLARREERLADLADTLEAEYDVTAMSTPANVRSREAVEDAVETATDGLGPLDVVVANAGLARGSTVTELTDEEYFAMQETNVDGMFFVARATLPDLIETEGAFVAIGSFAGQFPRSFNPVYAATKWWVRGFTHSLAAQFGDRGVSVSVINPSEVRTEFGGQDGESFADQFAPGEVTEPAEVADAVAFAVEQSPSSVQELNLYRRDKYADSGF